MRVTGCNNDPKSGLPLETPWVLNVSYKYSNCGIHNIYMIFLMFTNGKTWNFLQFCFSFESIWIIGFHTINYIKFPTMHIPNSSIGWECQVFHNWEYIYKKFKGVLDKKSRLGKFQAVALFAVTEGSSIWLFVSPQHLELFPAHIYWIVWHICSMDLRHLNIWWQNLKPTKR